MATSRDWSCVLRHLRLAGESGTPDKPATAEQLSVTYEVGRSGILDVDITGRGADGLITSRLSGRVCVASLPQLADIVASLG